MNSGILRRLALIACVLAANALLAGIVWIGTEPDAYLWVPRTAPETLEAVRKAGVAVFWRAGRGGRCC